MPPDIGSMAARMADDPLFSDVSRALAGSRQGDYFACGEYLLEVAAGVPPGGILVACCPPVAEAVERIARATGLFPAPGSQGAVNLSRQGRRSVTLVPRGDVDIRAYLSDSAFTVLALAVDLAQSSPVDVLDPLEGLSDLQARVLRLTARGAASRDPERCLLAADLRARFSLEPDEDTLNALREASGLVTSVPPPRAWKALARLYSGRGLASTSAFLRETGTLGSLIAEVGATYDVPQNYYHHLGVWDHTLETLDLLEEMLEDPASRFKAYGGRLEKYLASDLEAGVSRRAYLAIAGLIHDIGKPLTMTVEPSGRIRFQGHQTVGGGLALSIASRLGLGRKGATHLSAIVRDHMRLGFLIKEGETTATRLSAATDMDDHCVEVVMLSVADRMATRGEASTPEALDLYKRVAARVLADWMWTRTIPPLIDGRDVMMHAGIGEGPQVAQALFKARVAQRECIVSSRAEALEFLAPDFKGKMDTRGR